METMFEQLATKLIQAKMPTYQKEYQDRYETFITLVKNNELDDPDAPVDPDDPAASYKNKNSEIAAAKARMGAVVRRWKTEVIAQTTLALMHCEPGVDISVHYMRKWQFQTFGRAECASKLVKKYSKKRQPEERREQSEFSVQSQKAARELYCSPGVVLFF